jgi:hypothetical protein
MMQKICFSNSFSFCSSTCFLLPFKIYHQFLPRPMRCKPRNDRCPRYQIIPLHRNILKKISTLTMEPHLEYVSIIDLAILISNTLNHVFFVYPWIKLQTWFPYSRICRPSIFRFFFDYEVPNPTSFYLKQKGLAFFFLRFNWLLEKEKH